LQKRRKKAGNYPKDMKNNYTLHMWFRNNAKKRPARKIRKPKPLKATHNNTQNYF